MTSMAFGTEPESTEQTGLVPPGAQTPNVNAPAAGVNARAWSGWNPSCPVSTTLNAQPGPGVPNWASGSAIVTMRLASSDTMTAVPAAVPLALTHTGAANPCASTRSLQAPAGAI